MGGRDRVFLNNTQEKLEAGMNERGHFCREPLEGLAPSVLLSVRPAVLPPGTGQDEALGVTGLDTEL